MFEEFMEEVENIKNQIVNLYSPFKVILFGSIAKKCVKLSSDIDICVIIDTNNKSELIRDMYLKINSDKPYDIVVYTTTEFERFKEEKMSFLYKILKEGVTIHG